MMVTAHVLSGTIESCRSWEDCPCYLADKKEAEEKLESLSSVRDLRMEQPDTAPAPVSLGKGTGGTCRSFRRVVENRHMPFLT